MWNMTLVRLAALVLGVVALLPACVQAAGVKTNAAIDSFCGGLQDSCRGACTAGYGGLAVATGADHGCGTKCDEAASECTAHLHDV
jgi:hypothetical protein